MQKYSAGELPHARSLVLGLFDLLENNRMSSHPFPTGSLHSTVVPYSGVGRGSWFRLMGAMTRSLTTGIFLDSTFYVEDSMELRPLYFCSSVTPALFKKISGQCERNLSSVGLSENERTEIGKLVPIGSLHGSSERVISRSDNVVASQDVTDQKVLVINSGDFRT